MFRQWTPLPSGAVKWVSGHLLSGGRDLGLYLEFPRGSESSLCVVL